MLSNNSSRNTLANLSVAVLSKALPASSKAVATLGTGNILVTKFTPIFQSVNCKETNACVPPNMPAETVQMEIGLFCHSSYKRSIAFFKLAGYPPLYSGVTIIIPSAAFILLANSKTFSAGFLRVFIVPLNSGKL